MIIETTVPNGGKIRFDREAHTYDLEIVGTPPGEPVGWIRVPSVTTILNIFHKPALVWWGMQVGVRGMLELIETQGVRETVDDLEFALPVADWQEDQVIAALTKNKLTVNHVTKAAGDRGINVHDFANAWAKSLEPETAIAPEEQGYVDAFQNFVAHHLPIPKASEIPCASWRDLWAGTPDLLATIEGDLWLLDYKTSKRVYETHHGQLAFYHEGLYESGYFTEDEYYNLRKGVVLLKPDGKFKLVESTHVDPIAVKNILAGWKGYSALKPPPKRKKKSV